jgi:hypothetical protein
MTMPSAQPYLDCSMARIVDFAAPLGQKAGPGMWNDLDMLEVIHHVGLFLHSRIPAGARKRRMWRWDSEP